MAQNSNSNSVGQLGEKLGTTGETNQPTRQRFSEQAAQPTPELTRSFKRSSDTTSGVLASLYKTGTDAYEGIQAARVENAAGQVQGLAQLDRTGGISAQQIEAMSKTNALFAKYASARRQGAMTDGAANIAIESEIKRISNQFPALAPEVQRQAAQTLGFDPTGSEYRFATRGPSPSSQHLDPLQEAIKQAGEAEQTLGLPQGTLQRQVVQNHADNIQLTAIKNRQQAGQANANDFLNGASLGANKSIMKARSDLLHAVQKDPETGRHYLTPDTINATKTQLAQQRDQQINDLRSNAGKYDLTPSQVNTQVDAINQQYKDFTSTLDDFNLNSIRKNTSEANDASIQVFLQNTQPVLAVAKALDPNNTTAAYTALMNPNSALAGELNKLTVTGMDVNSAGGIKTYAAMMRYMYSNDRGQLPAGMTQEQANKAVMYGAANVINNPEAGAASPEKAGINALENNEKDNGVDINMKYLAENPAQHVSNPTVINYLKRNVNATSLSYMAHHINSSFADSDELHNKQIHFKIDKSGKIVPDNYNGNHGVVGDAAMSVMNFFVSSAGGQTNDPQSVNRYVNKIEQMGQVLSDPQMAQAVGMSKQQLVTKLNQASKSTNEEGQEQQPQMTPVAPEKVTEAAEQLNVDPAIANGIARTESDYGASAPYSAAGAGGVFQLMPDTARDQGLTVDGKTDERLDNTKNIHAGLSYYKKQLESFGKDNVLALMAYNWGPENVKEVLKSKNPQPSIPSETLDYVSKVLGHNVDVVDYLRKHGYINTY